MGLVSLEGMIFLNFNVMQYSMGKLLDDSNGRLSKDI